MNDFEFLTRSSHTLFACEQNLQRGAIAFLDGAEVEDNIRLFGEIFEKKIAQRACSFNIEDAANLKHLAIALIGESHHITRLRP